MAAARTTLAICILGSALALSTALLPVKAQEPADSPPRKEMYIDPGVQMIFLPEDGVPIHRYAVSTGKQSTPTPVGEFQIYRKQELRISSLATPYRMQYYLSCTKSGSMGMHALPHLGVSIENGSAVVNFKREALDILNSAAARQHMVKSPIRMTLFPTITDVTYAIEGEIFEEWDA